MPIQFMSDGQVYESLADASIPNLLAEKFCFELKRKMGRLKSFDSNKDYDDMVETDIENELALRMADDIRLNHALNNVAVPKGPIKKESWDGKGKETHG